ncbi:Uncharacterised protein [Mycobacteroides abscessus subsp. abscessus]|nr:Uncharacterised protein [Mycobacteroides abscessus subsp. abscessus]
MIGVTDVDAHGQAKQLATEMVFQPGAHDLLTVVEVFGSNESDDGVDQERFQVTGHRIGPGLQGLLINWFTAGTQVSTRTQRGALPRFQIHDVVTDGPAAQGPGGVAALTQQRDIDAESGVGALGSGDRLKRQVHRRSPLDQADRGRDV